MQLLAHLMALFNKLLCVLKLKGEILKLLLQSCICLLLLCNFASLLLKKLLFARQHLFHHQLCTFVMVLRSFHPHGDLLHLLTEYLSLMLCSLLCKL